MSLERNNKYLEAVNGALDAAMSGAPHATLQQGMAEEVEVGRSAAETQPQVILYARQNNKTPTTTFKEQMGKLKKELNDFDLPVTDVLEESTKGFDVRFVQVSDAGDAGGYTSGSAAPGVRVTTTTGTHEYKPPNPPGQP